MQVHAVAPPVRFAPHHAAPGRPARSGTRTSIAALQRSDTGPRHADSAGLQVSATKHLNQAVMKAVGVLSAALMAAGRHSAASAVYSQQHTSNDLVHMLRRTSDVA